MGDSDRFIGHDKYGLYCPYIFENIDVENIKSIAWLGWVGKNILIKNIEEKCRHLEKSDLYDIDTSEGASYWDINEDWDISGYDLVICLRTTLFVKDKEHFLRNLKKLINNNKKVIFDFILPKSKHVSDFSRNERNLLKQINVTSEVDYFFSYLEIRPGSENVEVSLPPWSQYAATGLPQFSNMFVDIHPHRAGYVFLPCFNEIYSAEYEKETGASYNERRVAFIAQNEKEKLYQEDFSRYGLNSYCKSHKFRYFLNYLPQTDKERERMSTTLFTFEK